MKYDAKDRNQMCLKGDRTSSIKQERGLKKVQRQEVNGDKDPSP